MTKDNWELEEEYDFSEGARGPVRQPEAGKERITIRLDKEVLDWFRAQVEGGGSYQTMINRVLREHIGVSGSDFDSRVRSIVRDELAAHRKTKVAARPKTAAKRSR